MERYFKKMCRGHNTAEKDFLPATINRKKYFKLNQSKFQIFIQQLNFIFINKTLDAYNIYYHNSVIFFILRVFIDQ